jgi:hypothetical protein
MVSLLLASYGILAVMTIVVISIGNVKGCGRIPISDFNITAVIFNLMITSIYYHVMAQIPEDFTIANEDHKDALKTLRYTSGVY